MSKIVAIIAIDEVAAIETMSELSSVIRDLRDIIAESQDPEEIEAFTERAERLGAFCDAWFNRVPLEADTNKRCTCDSKVLLIKGCQCGGK
jgi:hypothetical protein